MHVLSLTFSSLLLTCYRSHDSIALCFQKLVPRTIIGIISVVHKCHITNHDIPCVLCDKQQVLGGQKPQIIYSLKYVTNMDKNAYRSYLH